MSEKQSVSEKTLPYCDEAELQEDTGDGVEPPQVENQRDNGDGVEPPK
ncbi:hypothetical protein [Parashewanella curva]|nr:hypothetical protein [Parashewanella curva]